MYQVLSKYILGLTMLLYRSSRFGVFGLFARGYVQPLELQLGLEVQVTKYRKTGTDFYVFHLQFQITEQEIDIVAFQEIRADSGGILGLEIDYLSRLLPKHGY